jgi:hypothetical protein
VVPLGRFGRPTEATPAVPPELMREESHGRASGTGDA